MFGFLFWKKKQTTSTATNHTHTCAHTHRRSHQQNHSIWVIMAFWSDVILTDRTDIGVRIYNIWMKDAGFSCF